MLDRGERYSCRFKDLRDALGLPRVGERIRSRQHDTVWKVIEEKEQWLGATGKDGAGGAGPEPAILLRYWKENANNGPDSGKTLYYLPPAQTCLIFRMVALWTLRVDVSSTATSDAVRKLADEKIADVCGTIRSALQTEMARDYLELPLGCLSG